MDGKEVNTFILLTLFAAALVYSLDYYANNGGIKSSSGKAIAWAVVLAYVAMSGSYLWDLVKVTKTITS